MRLLLIGSFVLLSACQTSSDDDDDTPTPSFPAELADDLSTELQSLHTAYDVPGIAAAVMLDDGTSWVGVAGDADLAGTALEETSRFKLASVTKSFVAGLALATGLDLNATIEPWIDHPRAAEITVRQLLDHSAGIVDYSTTRTFREGGVRSWTDTELVALIAEAPLLFEPGTSFHYSNTHYVMAAMILEAEQGRPWQASLEAEVFDVLGLSATSAPDGDDEWGDVVRGFLGTQDLTDSIHPSALGGAGNIIGDAADAVTWANGLWGGALLGDDTSLLWDGSANYGLGTLIIDDEHGRQLAHNGAVNGYVSWAGHRPEQGMSVAVLANAWLPGPNPMNPLDGGDWFYSQELADALWAIAVD